MVCFLATSRRIRRTAKNKGPINALLIVNPVEKRDRFAKTDLVPKGTAAKKANARALKRLSKLQARADRRGLSRNYFKDFIPLAIG